MKQEFFISASPDDWKQLQMFWIRTSPKKSKNIGLPSAQGITLSNKNEFQQNIEAFNKQQ